MNLIDLIVILYLGIILALGYRRGFFRQTLDFVVLILAFFISFKLFSPLGTFIGKNLNFPESYSQVAAFFLVWFVIEVIYYIFFIIFYEQIPEKIRDSKINRSAGLIPAFFRGILSIWIIFSLILFLPTPNSFKDIFTESFTGKNVAKTLNITEKYLGNIFGKAIDDTISFLTIKPESDERVTLGFIETDVYVDTNAENEMLALVNEERVSRGLKPLVMDKKLQEVARNHSKDMFKKGYFAHINLEALSPFDRMDKAGIKYLIAGENLALAPDVKTAHSGLMKSPGHKANILTVDFAKVGIGVIASKDHGLMFSQEFTD